MNLSIPDYGEKIESDSNHWSLVLDKEQMTNKQYRDLYER
jgi:hypothetical protein